MHKFRFLFLHAFIAFSAVAASQAQVVTPNPAPTLIKTAPYTITKPGFYQLGANLTYVGNGSDNDAIITINASNVTLDFAGHYISGPSNKPTTTLYGVFANERGNLNIQNGTVTFCYAGIYLIGNGQTGSLNINQRVTNMLVSYCYLIGIDFLNGRNSEVANSRISFIGGTSLNSNAPFGVVLASSGMRVVNCSVTDVDASRSGVGIGFSGSLSGFAIGNTVSDCAIAIQLGTAQNNLANACTTGFYLVNDGGNNKSF